jgi:RNA polymerase sigma-70 factor, ECF subfamily
MTAEEARERRFHDAVAANQRRILAIARSYARGEECRDLCQDILLQMWRGLDSFAGRSSPDTWVYRVALNTAITFRRKNGRRIDPSCRSINEPFPEPAAPPSPGSEVVILEEFLHSLPKIDRAVFLLYLEDLGKQS